MLPILTVPHPLLRQKSKPVAAVDKKVARFIADLTATLIYQHKPKGVGLSAPQVGKLWRIFLIYLPKDKPVIQVFINPAIISASKKLTLGPDRHKPILEGCLSIPRLYGPVYRHQWIKLKYLILDTKYSILQKTAKFSDFPARVIQHELDHLDGILFTDRSLKDKLPVYEETNGQLTHFQA